MRFFKSFIIINTLSCLIIATPNVNTGKTELNDFLRQIQQRTGIATKTVKIDDSVNSVNDFFKSSPSSGTLDNNIWQVTDDGVNSAGNLIFSVVSCEYSESTYYLAQTLTSTITAFYKNDMPKYRTDIQNFFFAPMKDVLSSMVLTLIGLLKYTKHYSQKYQEFLNTLLSWYVTIVHSDYVEVDKNRTNSIHYVDNTLTVIYQVEKYLKIFILTNCHNVDDFARFSTAMDNEFKQINDIEGFKSLLKTKLNTLQPLLYQEFLKKTYVQDKLFVLTPTVNYSSGIQSLISQQALSALTIIKWDSKTTAGLSTIYENYISKNASGIYSLLKFERIFLQNITKIIMGYISNELKNILSDDQLSETKLNEYQGKIIYTLDKYIQQFHDDGQPILLINNMSTIRNDLLILTNNKKFFGDRKLEIGKYIAKLNESKTDVPPETGLTKLNHFLNVLSGKVICAKLHPVVSNAYWGKLYFSTTKISNYVIDLRFLQIKYETLPAKSSSICKTMSYISSRLVDIQSTISNCENEMKSGDSQKITTCLNSLSSKYSRLKVKINEIVSNIHGLFYFNWKKLLLSVFSNIKNVESYESGEKEINIIIKDLNILQNTISEYFRIGFELTCKSLPTWIEGFSFEPDTTLSQDEYRGLNRKLVDIIAYQDFFKTINDFISKIIASDIESELTLYWDGHKMTLKKVYEMYKLYSLDQLQINYDYFKFLVRWFVAVVYSKIIEITKEIIKSNTSGLSPKVLSKVFFVDDLELIFQEFLKLPLYISMPVSNILGVFVSVLKSYDGTKNDGLDNYINLLEFELENLDYSPPTTTSSRKRTFSIYIQLLIQKIKSLVSIYETEKFIIEKAVINIGVDLNDQYMMFHEWN